MDESCTPGKAGGLKGIEPLKTHEPPKGGNPYNNKKVEFMGMFTWLRRRLKIQDLLAIMKKMETASTSGAIPWQNDSKLDEIHRHIDFVQRDLLIAMQNKLGFCEEHSIELSTEYPLAVDSYDHIYPQGTIADNTRCPQFFRKIESIFAKEKISFLDLGCAGGGLVFDAVLRGHFGIGLEGSDASLHRQRAEWRLLRNNLFTCDITKEYILRDKKTGETQQFDVISAWEVLEHLPEDAFPQFFTNVRKHLSDEGRFFASVAFWDDIVNGVNRHVTVKPREWWEELFLRNGFILEESLSPVFMARGGCNPPLCHKEPRIPDPQGNFSFALSKKLASTYFVNNIQEITYSGGHQKDKIYVLNDTATRAPDHLGCATVMRNFGIIAEKFGMTVNFRDASDPNVDFNYDEFVSHMSESEYLILNGEGTLHDDAAVLYLKRCRIAKELGKKVILVNTVWENNSKLNSFLGCFDLISARESLSGAALINAGAQRERVFVIPDIFFYDPSLFYSTEMRRDTKICFTDCSLNNHTKKLDEMAKSLSSPLYTMRIGDFGLLATPYVVSGRFHATCFCIRMNIPTLSIAANTYKTEGMLRDAGISLEKYYIKNADALTEDRIHSFMEMDHTEYIELANCYATSAVDKINDFFERIFNL